METQKRRRGDRRDGRLLRELDSLHFITGIIYPNRCDNEAYISERIDLTPVKAYMARRNETETVSYTHLRPPPAPAPAPGRSAPGPGSRTAPAAGGRSRWCPGGGWRKTGPAPAAHGRPCSGVRGIKTAGACAGGARRADPFFVPPFPGFVPIISRIVSHFPGFYKYGPAALYGEKNLCYNKKYYYQKERIIP